MRLRMEAGVVLTNKPYQLHLRSANDLITPYEAIRAGFVELALEKNRRATPIVAEARALKAVASRAASPAALADVEGIRSALLTAAGISDKASRHMAASDRDMAIEALVKEFLEPAGRDFVEELVYRYLLTKGDALGGVMRNQGGLLGLQRFTRAVMAALSLAGHGYYWMSSTSRSWQPRPADDSGIERHTRGLGWAADGTERTLLYNLKVPRVGKNVDLSLLNARHDELDTAAITEPALYLACGEVKGGIDPAGADEHWKTAGTARCTGCEGPSQSCAFFRGRSSWGQRSLEVWPTRSGTNSRTGP